MTDRPGTRSKWRGLTVSTEYPSESAGVCRQRINGHRGKEFLDEGLAPRLPFGRISTVDTVNEFDDTDGQ